MSLKYFKKKDQSTSIWCLWILALRAYLFIFYMIPANMFSPLLLTDGLWREPTQGKFADAYKVWMQNLNEDWIWNSEKERTNSQQDMEFKIEIKTKRKQKFTILSTLYQIWLSPSSHYGNQWKTVANQASELQNRSMKGSENAVSHQKISMKMQMYHQWISEDLSVYRGGLNSRLKWELNLKK